MNKTMKALRQVKCAISTHQSGQTEYQNKTWTCFSEYSRFITHEFFVVFVKESGERRDVLMLFPKKPVVTSFIQYSFSITRSGNDIKQLLFSPGLRQGSQRIIGFATSSRIKVT